jgi:dTDP-4-dehydrorhamnose 3,5-epimerase
MLPCMDRLSIDGAWVHTPTVRSDPRGTFHEAFRAADLRAAIGHPMQLAQINSSTSRRGVLRGVHFAAVPPGQAKYVTCVSGSVLDVAVDLRVGSPTFLRWESVILDDATHKGIYLAEGLGHAFLALSDQATVVYVVSQPYAPDREHGIDPLDPDLGIDWPAGLTPLLSDKDAAAPTVKEAMATGLLPEYDACQAYYRSLTTG